MARCTACTRFARFMETDEPAAPQRSAHVHPDAVAVHIPSSLSAEEPVLRERHGDMIAAAMAAASPGYSPSLPVARQVSISLPASPTGFGASRTEAELERHARTDAPRRMMMPPRAPVAVALAQPDKVVFRSQPIPAAPPGENGAAQGHGDPSRSAPHAARSKARRDKSYDSFKTWSGKLEKQITTHLLGGRPPPPQPQEEEPEEDDAASNRRLSSSMPQVQRFFAALEGPELDKLRVLLLLTSVAAVSTSPAARAKNSIARRVSSTTSLLVLLLTWQLADRRVVVAVAVVWWQSSEELILPSDKTWPFLLRFPVSAFGMCMGMSSQAILWKRIAISASTRFLHITVKVNLVLWCVSVALMFVVSVLYACKVVFYFEAVRREYYHPIRVNFFFAPWIACLFLAIGVPDLVAASLPHWLWYVLMAPIVCLELKIYGQWISGGQRRLSRVANPSNHLSIVGNFVGALLGGIMGLKEGPMFFFSVGLAHYMVLFVTLYQRLPTSETLPRDLHPVFFLFVAAPSVACLAWARITGEFGYGSRVAYFIAMFLYASLAVRVNLFRGFSFSLAWWAYTFPMTSAAIASIRYASEVKNAFTQCMCTGLTAAATLTVTALFLTTLLHAVVHRDLFPNDISIAITERRRKPIFAEEMRARKRRGWGTKQQAAAALDTAASDAADLEAARAATTLYT
ncbi:S-type anion channel SLAH3-like isoform X1 [Panicum hallii]|uniref:S-type anion channel SLAH3-like isoform X1 n=1 Tax=Panicum hallii TaxID=206008 RepID=UPI000DF4F124|nr:S-type anion channel SLAH3-like isoform X1 [Panicum hallii]